MNYYKKKQILASVNKKGEIIGKIDKWAAHKKGVLHQAFSVILKYENYYIMQYRKHPVFDHVFDVTSSSHQIYKNNRLEKIESAVYNTLRREWGLKPSDFSSKLINKGFVIYKAYDKNSLYNEHEYCFLLEADIKKIPKINTDFAYGLILLTKDDIYNDQLPIRNLIAPWVKEMIYKKLI
jgi:isopentenyldiphosphate isomerase